MALTHGGDFQRVVPDLPAYPGDPGPLSRAMRGVRMPYGVGPDGSLLWFEPAPEAPAAWEIE